jgi:aldose sugar dehydrogenase
MTIGTGVSGERKRNHVFPLLVQGAIGSLGVFLILGAWLDRPLWQQGERLLLVSFLIGCAYGATALGIIIGELRGRRATVVQILLVASAAALPALVAFVVVQPPFSYWLLYGGLTVVVLLALGVFSVHGRHALKFAVLTVFVIAGVALQVRLATGIGREAPPSATVHLETSLYDLNVVSFPNRVPRISRDQGGLTLFGDRYLLTTGDGDLYAFRRGAEGNDVEIQTLPYKAPINIGDFEAAAAGLVPAHWFRVADALAQETAGGLRLFVTHHFWNVQDQCWVMRVSALEGPFEAFLSPSAALEWSTVFETSPCMPLSPGKDEPIKFTGVENGGRLSLLSDDQLLISIGDHEMDGWATKVAAAQEPTWTYGKTILIDLRDRSHEVFSLGHRNPQGLFISPSGKVWETEHGPEGGDELNLITRGGNYGWPVATFGVEYGTNMWPLTTKAGSHDGYALPFYSWIPSIGVSALIEVTSPRFENWRGDLLVGSLAAQSLWRLRIREDRVVLVERITMDARVRDILEGHDGELVLWMDGPSNRAIRFVEPGEGVATGEYMYRVCSGCHVPPPGLPAGVGPPLTGILDRDVAAEKGFAYSPAMLALGGKWTRERLDEFLRDPRSAVPGTTMFFPGVADEQSREALLDYLADPDSRLDVAPIAPL